MCYLIDTFPPSKVKYYRFRIDNHFHQHLQAQFLFFNFLFALIIFFVVLSRYLHSTYQLLLILIHVLLIFDLFQVLAVEENLSYSDAM